MADEFNSNRNNLLNGRHATNTASMGNQQLKSGYQWQLAQDLSSKEPMEFQSPRYTSLDSLRNATGYPANQVSTDFFGLISRIR